jgi:hypothetical protein
MIYSETEHFYNQRQCFRLCWVRELALFVPAAALLSILRKQSMATTFMSAGAMRRLKSFAEAIVVAACKHKRHPAVCGLFFLTNQDE